MTQPHQSDVKERVKCPQCEKEWYWKKHDPKKVLECPNCSWNGDLEYPDG